MKTFYFTFRSVLISLLLLGAIANAQDPVQYGTPFSGVPDRRDVVIYQVNMRSFSSTRNLQGVINRLDNIKALGVNVIQLMPVQPVATLNAFNSPYAWKDFVSVGSEYGSLTTLRALVDGAHARGIAVIMDWVANQTGWDHPWITAHKDWYVQNSSGVIQNLNGWTDVAALNMTNAAMKAEMINCLRYWVFAANIDGFRVDYANNAPSFWTSVISNLRGITTHKLLMVAEGDASGLFGAGFDMTFSWTFYGNLKSIKSGSAVTIINNTNTSDYNGATGTQQVVRWLSNHDIYGSEGSPYTVLGGKAAVLADFVVSAYMKSVPFIYNGMEVGNTVAMPFPFTGSTINWSQDVSITPLMTQIIAFRNSSEAIRRGTLTTYSNSNVCAFKKVSGTETVFVLSNLRNSSQTFTLPSGIANTTMVDAFTNASVSLGSSITLSAYQYRVFKNGTTTNTLTVSPTSLSVGSAASNSTVAVTSNVSWTVTSNQTWITVSPTSGSNNANITVSVTANTGAARTGTVTVTGGGITQTVNISQSAASGTTTYYSIKNRWKGTYLYDAGANVGYGTSVANNNYLWEKVAIDATYFYLKNAGTGEYMHIQGQTGSVQCDAGNLTWTYQQWSQVAVDATWSRIVNRGQTTSMIHVEGQTGFAQYAGAQTSWWSAQWQFTAAALKSADDEEIVVDVPVEISLYPMPVTNKLLNIDISGYESDEYKLVIYSMDGSLVLSKMINSSEQIQLDVPEGLYILKIQSDVLNYSKKIAVY